MRKIYKYQLKNMPVETLEIPVGSIFLHLAEQDKFITLWFDVNTNREELLERTFYLVMTGSNVPKNTTYLGTVLMSFHGLVAHLYEEQ